MLRQARVFNPDQGSQFTGAAFTSALVGHGIAISMDGKGAWRDNVFVVRLWRSVKYEEVYLRAYDSVSEARASIGRYFEFYLASRSRRVTTSTSPVSSRLSSLASSGRSVFAPETFSAYTFAHPAARSSAS